MLILFLIDCLLFSVSRSPLQTVLLCSPSKDVLCDMEERFWNCIHRLKNALSCGRVLPGAGEIETACIRRLNELAGKNSDYQFLPWNIGVLAWDPNPSLRRLSTSSSKFTVHRHPFIHHDQKRHCERCVLPKNTVQRPKPGRSDAHLQNEWRSCFLCQEPITRSVQLLHIPVTAFLQIPAWTLVANHKDGLNF